MPNILIDARSISDPAPGGITRVAKIWIINQTKSYLPADCYCITTGLKPSATVRNFCLAHGYQYLHLKTPNKLWTLFCHLNLASIILSAEKKLKRNIDLLLLPNIAYTGALYRPYRILVHDLSFLIEPEWFNLKRRLWHKFIAARRRIANADEIHCVSLQTLLDVMRLLHVPASQCKIFRFDPAGDMRNACPSMPEHGRPAKCEMRPAWLPNTALRFVLMLGGSDPRKNILVALKAVAEFNLKNPKNHLIPIVLGGRISFGVGRHKVACIQTPDFINDEVLAWLYQNAFALLYPSWYEGFGLPLHEAHQFNTPVIASTAGALPETAPPGTIFCHPAKIHEWIEALEICMSRLNSPPSFTEKSHP